MIQPMYNPLHLFVNYVGVSLAFALIAVYNSFDWLVYGACGLFVVGVVHSVTRLYNLLNWED